MEELERPAALPAQLERRGVLLAALRADDASDAIALLLVGTKHRFGERPVGIVVEPDLRLGDVGRDFPDNARRMFVEDMGLDARVRKAIDEEIGLDTMRRDEYPLHRYGAG